MMLKLRPPKRRERVLPARGAIKLPQPQPLTDHIWKKLTRSANVHFADGRYAQAAILYAEALMEADRVFSAAQRGAVMAGCDPAPMLVASVANAAENWVQMGRYGQGAQALIALCHRFCAVIEEGGNPAALRAQCVIHLKVVVQEIMLILPHMGC